MQVIKHECKEHKQTSVEIPTTQKESDRVENTSRWVMKNAKRTRFIIRLVAKLEERTCQVTLLGSFVLDEVASWLREKNDAKPLPGEAIRFTRFADDQQK